MEHTLRTHAVRFAEFGDPDVLEVVEVPTPEPGEGEVLVEVFATGLNPVESAIRRGDHPERWPVDFPSPQGRDLAGVVVAVGPGVQQFARGDEVMGYVDRGAQATYVAVPERQLLPKPPSLTWEVAGSLYVAGTTAWTAIEGLALGPSDEIVITAAAGGVGCLAAQFARMRGATVIGTCAEMRFDFLRQFGVIPMAYGPGLADRVRVLGDDPNHPAGGRPVSAFLDFLGGQTHEAIKLGVPRIADPHDPRLGGGAGLGGGRALPRRRRRARPGRRTRGRASRAPAHRRRVPARLDRRRVPGARPS